MQQQLKLNEIVKICMCTKFANCSGRARRSEYWGFFSFVLLINILIYELTMFIFVLIDDIVGGFRIYFFISDVIHLIVLIPTLCALVRRLHDTGRSGCYFFLVLIPFVGSLFLIYYLCLDSDPTPNVYGLSPKYSGSNPQANNQTENLISQSGPMYSNSTVIPANGYPQQPYQSPFPQQPY